MTPSLERNPREWALEALVREVKSFITEPDIDRLLVLITESAKRLTNARYAAVGLFGEAGEVMTNFIAAGMDEETKARISRPPTGKGLLGAIPSDGSLLRLSDLTQHPAFRGFPPGHPSMRSFLGISLLAHGRLFGRLYLADKCGSDGTVIDFTELDEDIVTLLASHAGAAIENCLLLQSIKRRKERHKRTLASLPVSVVQVTRDLAIHLANRTLCELIQVQEADLLGRPLLQVLPVNQLASFLAPLQEGSRDITTLEIECAIPDKTPGQHTPRLLSFTATSVGEGEQFQIVLVIQDRTEFKRLEDQFRQSQKLELVGTLAGGIAHDFNNILTIISGHSQLASMKAKPGDPIHADLERITQAAARAAGLTHQLLAFCRAQIVQRKAVNLNRVIEQLSDMLKRLIGEDIVFQMELAPELRSIQTDPVQMEQVILNLVINARQAMSKGGLLTLRTRNVEIPDPLRIQGSQIPAGSYVQLVVQDTGCGMSQDILDHIFEPFFTTKPPGEGTGLGLSTVYGIVEHNRGFIVPTSAPGRGTTFTLTFPAVECTPDAERASRSSAIPERHGQETILLVEDELGIRALLTDILTFHGYRVLEAPSPGEAVELSQHHPGSIDLLITDVVMPELSGWEVAEYFLTHHPRIKILLISGYPAERAIRHAPEQCPTGQRNKPTNGPISLDDFSPRVSYLQKPFSPQQLVTEIQRLLST